MGILFWRIAVIWLLALALPVQALAAASRLLCSPANLPGPPCHSMAMEVAMEVPMEVATEAAMGMAGPGEAQMGEQVAEAGALPNEPAPEQEVGSGHGCSACAACCHALAPPSALPSLGLTSVQSPALSPLIAGHTQPPLGGLERPPRLARR